LIRDGELGRIDTIHTGFSELFTSGVSPAWLLNRRLAGGGPLMDLGIYCVNTSRWLVDEDPVEVTAESWRHDRVRFRQVEEGISFCLRFPSGLIVQATSTYSAMPSSFICVQGSEGWASLMPAYDFKEERRLTAKIAGRQIERRFRVIDEFAPQLDAFASAIQGRSALEPDGLQGHRDVIILQSIYDAAKRRKPVTIRYE
jgi:predicted dehydrogenase